MNRTTQSQSENSRPDEGVHLEDYWRVVWHRGWLILLITAVTLGAATWAAYRRPQLYQAHITLQVGDPRGPSGRVGSVDLSPNLLWTDPVESEVQHLTTRAVAEFAVDSLDLRVTTPGASRESLLEHVQASEGAPTVRFELTITEDGRVTVRTPADNVVAEGRAGTLLQFAQLAIAVRPQAPPGEYTLAVIPRADAVNGVIGGLAASTRPETNLIDVTYTGTDRGLTPRTLNTVAVAARTLGVQRIRDWAQSRTRFIANQLEESGGNLQNALEAVEDYKEQRGLTSLTSEESRLLQRFSDLQSQLEKLVIERNLYRDLIGRISSGVVEPNELQQLATLSDISDSRAVQFYFDRLLSLLEERSAQLAGGSAKDPSHPEIRALDSRIRNVQDQLIAAAENAASTLEARIEATGESLSRLQAQLREFPALETEIQRLKNQVEIHTDMYKYLLSKYQEAQISEAEISPYLEIVDPASWARPVSGNRTMNIVFGGLIGLLLGLGSAFFLEYLDRSVQSTVDVESGLGLAVLGWIPRIETAVTQTPFPLVAVEDPSSPAAEAYRVLRTNLAFSTAREERLLSLLFTSPGPGEGKSTTVANLAAVLASRGDRTLLIDADLRRGLIHRAFDLLRSPGLTGLLAGEIDPREAIRPSVRPGLDVLPAGQQPPNPSELLGSRSMVDLLEEWKDEYRWVLLDAPPVLAVTDPAVLAGLTDGTILILRAGGTDQRAAWRAVQQLRRVDARLVGAVLNEIRSSRSPDGYYVDYYYSRYTEPAESETERAHALS